MREKPHQLENFSRWSRFELKYQINESQAAAITRFIAPYMRPDRYSELQEDGAYPIVSLYMDSPNLRLCRESLVGDKNRFKIRIRSYTDNLDYPRFFEIKRRMNTVIIKSRTRVLANSVAPLITGQQKPSAGKSAEDEVLNQFLFYKNMIIARPVVKVRYLRQAFEQNTDSRVRLTFDRNLCYCVTTRPEVEMNGLGWIRMPLKSVILEIKFIGRFPPWIARMAKLFALKQQSFSKYANSIRHACLLKYCAPVVSMNQY